MISLPERLPNKAIHILLRSKTQLQAGFAPQRLVFVMPTSDVEQAGTSGRSPFAGFDGSVAQTGAVKTNVHSNQAKIGVRHASRLGHVRGWCQLLIGARSRTSFLWIWGAAGHVWESYRAFISLVIVRFTPLFTALLPALPMRTCAVHDQLCRVTTIHMLVLRSQ